MPILKGKSQKTVSKNISKLMTEKPSAKRSKAIKTIAKKKGISPKKAKQKQAIAIALSEARKSGAKIPKYKKGGKVKKTGMAMVHKGERVLTKKQAKKFDSKRYEMARRKHFGMEES